MDHKTLMHPYLWYRLNMDCMLFYNHHYSTMFLFHLFRWSCSVDHILLLRYLMIMLVCRLINIFDFVLVLYCFLVFRHHSRIRLDYRGYMFTHLKAFNIVLRLPNLIFLLWGLLDLFRRSDLVYQSMSLLLIDCFLLG